MCQWTFCPRPTERHCAASFEPYSISIYIIDKCKGKNKIVRLCLPDVWQQNVASTEDVIHNTEII